MSGIKELHLLLKQMSPRLSDREYVFCTVEPGNDALVSQLRPIGTFQEDEGLTVVVERCTALEAGLQFSGVFRKITLHVHSSLEAVGLTAVVSTALANKGISANIIAAYHHDHLFVPSSKSDVAIHVLESLSRDQ